MSDRASIPNGVAEVEVEIRRGDLMLRAAEATGEITSDGQIDCTVDGRRAIIRSFGHHDNLSIALPASVERVTATTGRGEIVVDGVRAELHLRSGKGRVSLAGTGRAFVETGHGEIEVSDWAGGLELRTGHGDIRAEGLRGVRLNADTGHGEIEILGSLDDLRATTGHGSISGRCSLGAGSYEAHAAHGDVEFTIPADSDVRVEAVTSHGQVETDLPLVRVGRPGPAGGFGQRFVGSLGGPEPAATLRLFTNRGDVTIRRDAAGSDRQTTGPRAHAPAGPVWPPAPAPAPRAEEPPFSATERAWAETMAEFGEPPAAETAATPEPEPSAPASPAPRPALDERAILDAVRRGEMTIDEALALLPRED